VTTPLSSSSSLSSSLLSGSEDHGQGHDTTPTGSASASVNAGQDSHHEGGQRRSGVMTAEERAAARRRKILADPHNRMAYIFGQTSHLTPSSDGAGVSTPSSMSTTMPFIDSSSSSHSDISNANNTNSPSFSPSRDSSTSQHDNHHDDGSSIMDSSGTSGDTDSRPSDTTMTNNKKQQTTSIAKSNNMEHWLQLWTLSSHESSITYRMSASFGNSVAYHSFVHVIQSQKYGVMNLVID
jgi:hypothetical protein